MGRYYSGDIEGKFWFGVQNSDDASFFGGTAEEPSEINYYFDAQEDMKSVKLGIKKCKKALGKYEKQLDKFFVKNNGYNDEMVAKALKIPIVKVGLLLEWYARLQLGKKIEKCLLENESCSFSAEL